MRSFAIMTLTLIGSCGFNLAAQAQQKNGGDINPPMEVNMT